MTPETKSEIIVVGLAGAFLLFIWARNRHAGAGTGAENLPLLSDQQIPLPGAAPLFDIPAPVPGLDVTFNASPYALPSPNSFTLDAGSPSACNCASSGQGGSTFGSNSDLTAWLSSQSNVVSSAQDALMNWN